MQAVEKFFRLHLDIDFSTDRHKDIFKRRRQGRERRRLSTSLDFHCVSLSRQGGAECPTTDHHYGDEYSVEVTPLVTSGVIDPAHVHRSRCFFIDVDITYYY